MFGNLREWHATEETASSLRREKVSQFILVHPDECLVRYRNNKMS